MNSFNSSLVDAGVGTAIVKAGREEKTEVGRAGADTLVTGVALGLTDGDVVVFGLENT